MHTRVYPATGVIPVAFLCVLLQYLLSDKAITDIEVQYVWNIITNAAISRAFIKASSNDQFIVNDSPDVLKN